MKANRNDYKPEGKSFLLRYRSIIVGLIVGYSVGVIAGPIREEVITGIAIGLGCGLLLGIAWWRQWNLWLRMFLLVAISVFFVQICFDPTSDFLSCSRSDAPLTKQLQNALEKNLKRYGGKGASVAIIMPGGETWHGVSGVFHDTIRKWTAALRSGSFSITPAGSICFGIIKRFGMILKNTGRGLSPRRRFWPI